MPEGINTSDEHPLKEFLSLLFITVVLVLLAVAALSMLAGRLAPLIPFSSEEALLERTGLEAMFDTEHSATNLARETYLQGLAEQLAAHMELPGEIRLRVHYSSEDTVNAYASLGGHVVMFEGLLQALPHENALAMVMAHEIAHIKLRHPIVASGRALTVTLALASFGGIADNPMVASLLNSIGVSSILSFNRAQERAADEEALLALHKHYGHVAGAEALFEVLLEQSGLTPPEFLSTHPDSAARIERIKEYAAQHGLSGEPQSLPEVLKPPESSEH